MELVDFSDDGNLEGFPKECCHHAAKLLGIRLQGLGYSGFCVIHAHHEADVRREHAWLCSQDLIIDITADQFGDDIPAVIVTRDSAWHRQWEVEPQSSILVTESQCRLWLENWYRSRFAKIAAVLSSPAEANHAADRDRPT